MLRKQIKSDFSDSDYHNTDAKALFHFTIEEIITSSDKIAQW